MKAFVTCWPLCQECASHITAMRKAQSIARDFGRARGADDHARLALDALKAPTRPTTPFAHTC